MENPDDKLSLWLREKLSESGWSIRELARRSNISHSYLARITSGEVKPSAEICTAIASAFNVAPEILLRIAGILPEVEDEEDLELEALMNEWRKLSLEDRIATYLMARSLNHARRQREKERLISPAQTNKGSVYP